MAVEQVTFLSLKEPFEIVTFLKGCCKSFVLSLRSQARAVLEIARMNYLG